MNQSSALHGYEQTDPPRHWNIQPPAAHFKSSTSTLKTSLVVSAIMGRLNCHDIDNGDVKVHPSKFSVESNSESVLSPYNTPIKSIDGDEMEHLLEIFHSEHDDNLLGVDLQMLKV